MISSDVIKGRLCPICQVPGHVCGDDHMRRGPVDNFAPTVGGKLMAPEPQELKEYQYVVNNMITTAMLTPAMAERLGATEVGDDPKSLNGGYSASQNQAVYATADMGAGVTGENTTTPVRPQQMGVDRKGRTASARVTVDSLSDEDKAVYLNEETDDEGQPKAAERGPKAAEAPGDAAASTKARKAQDK